MAWRNVLGGEEEGVTAVFALRLSQTRAELKHRKSVLSSNMNTKLTLI